MKKKKKIRKREKKFTCYHGFYFIVFKLSALFGLFLVSLFDHDLLQFKAPINFLSMSLFMKITGQKSRNTHLNT